MDIDGRYICPWHGVQDDDGAALACGCCLQTGAHGRVFAVKSDCAATYAASIPDAESCKTEDESAT